MSNYTGAVYFLGKYRPLIVSGDNLEEIMLDLAIRANQAPPEVQERVMSLWRSLDERYARQSVEHGIYGASWVIGPPAIDPALWDALPPCPGLIYN